MSATKVPPTQPAQTFGQPMDGIAFQPAPLYFIEASGFAMEGHSTFWLALDRPTRQALIISMKGRLMQAGLATDRITLGAKELGLAEVDHNEAILVLAGYEAFASVTTDWASSF